MSQVHEGFIAVGKILGIFGFQGWVKVSAYSDVKNRFARVKAVYIESGTELLRKILTGHQYHRHQLLLKFEDLDDRESAREFSGSELFLPETEKVKLPPDHFFIHDLRGLKVYDSSDNFLGMVTEVSSAGSSDLLVIQTEGKEILVPLVAEFVLGIDLEKGKVIVRLWEDM
ncbi:MAG: 16S rRNA processing protein RimM [Caldithrix sp. RBG_13_44_9]|nr:MAG: 16S rRNA processing protein RimM [Caldithrix sp. RBG_13_44_9]